MNPLSTKYGGGGQAELIPYLRELATQNVSFSDTEQFGGFIQVANTGWTIAGLVSYLCAVPLWLPIGGNDFNNAYFLDSATCVSDILSELNYTQLMLLGSDAQFAGKASFFASHKIPYKDFYSYKREHKIPFGYKKNWGFEDSKLFTFARQELEHFYQTKKPFALYILTADTHFPNGFVDPILCSDLQAGYTNAVQCSDRLIHDFVTHAQALAKQYKQSTTIIILGDHLTMQQGLFPDNLERRIYNAFLNATFSVNPTTNLLHNRLLSHFDIAPLILDSIGIKTQAFGLGRNPLYTKTLLETFGLESFNQHITQHSRFYESLWVVNK
ncbi:sulfatase-like hydrolase/transferase [Helicobacter aurati]|uniref:sulfatase-like hydrolase/transferase n=1 Tax=Helicobacter aurati TaxID=137778 RepID=UPI000CF033E0|nr:sulfatase-like hydrolase/transferase [Helicobacter aurati]